ncbi:UDP-2,4-diacetamido-2,4,6-trideoxy-beta-L-altropyranose hydrolase [Geoalkalibacter halelectricus]|uniref:UDP-2,4-diacetamido-2,4, 6-trideoxy-beta-L-altropyranose hydrolase n=1 Tax=Geoalkalibacter halelectricus TaxID=2847045 RepID=A0ABY5ZSB4_9BACT|nr:UDP-2,4-diacetamido-2,4,6-trideoxy-beta-L-altropyranose hydrolase [Geoalkalibacter halelectricus]MDO3377979.1 UDP-2,4-diacetamido-2,4,6-trideoxy-beta-L-altropyranose hydrolase [Geoalkalibacter halelectricus]UWZ81518.1 UDP-2,4-diacetamido-2,4,6-trideoxy-beta-L-altropyranose hydrolase [Geoalkalibacter halelectricus]
MMRIAIRADSSTRIGSGHIMRCLALAEALRREGARVVFLCREEAGHLGEEIARRGFELVWVDDSGQNDPAGHPVRMAGGIDLLIVDHYALGHTWEEAMRPFARAIMVIDDLADRPHDCDLLLDQNLLPEMERRYKKLVPDGCRLLLGLAYALLREEFYTAAATAKERNQINHLLIFFGGGDPDNLTGRALGELESLSVTADIVIGGGNPHRRDLEARCRDKSDRWTLHVQTDRMAELMARADLALGAGGSTHWERCLLGLPALVVTVADNQVATTRLLHQKGACRWLGTIEDLPVGAFREAISDLLAHPQQLSIMSCAARKMVPPDGGTGKVVEAIKTLLNAEKVDLIR